MNCQEMQSLLHAYVDEELDVVSQLACERHLNDCPGCRQRVEALHALQAALRQEPLYWQKPAHLESRLAAALREENRDRQPRFRLPLFRRWDMAAGLLAYAGILLVILVGFWMSAQIFPPKTDIIAPLESGETRLAQEALDGHLRSLMANHLNDVASTDKHTVKPWFNGKLDYSPPVQDLAREGFPLVGGRLDYLSGRPVSALVYRHFKHYINLFVWPAASERPEKITITRLRGYSIFQWRKDAMNFVAVSDINSQDMQGFVALL